MRVATLGGTRDPSIYDIPTLGIQCVTNIILNFQYLRRHAYAAKIETRTMERA